MPQASPPHPAPTPGAGYLPEVWLLGSSTYSAQLAGQLGLPFSFAYHFAPAHARPGGRDLPTRTFARRDSSSSPHLMVAASVICAPDDDTGALAVGIERAQSPAASPRTPRPATHRPRRRPRRDERRAKRPSSPSPSPRTSSVHHQRCARDCDHLQSRTGADEIMVSTRIHDVDERRQSLELLAREWGLVAPTGARRGRVHSCAVTSPSCEGSNPRRPRARSKTPRGSSCARSPACESTSQLARDDVRRAVNQITRATQELLANLPAPRRAPVGPSRATPRAGPARV